MEIRALITRSSETEAYRSGPWRTVPYPRRQYQVLKEYVANSGLSESCGARAMKEILTDKTAACENFPADKRMMCSAAVPYDIYGERFECVQPCKADRVGCSKSDVGTNNALKLGIDVDACDSWGLTRSPGATFSTPFPLQRELIALTSSQHSFPSCCCLLSTHSEVTTRMTYASLHRRSYRRAERSWAI